MSLILCPPGAVTEAIQDKIDQGYTGLCSAVPGEQIGLATEYVGLTAVGFYPAWKGQGPHGSCTVVAATIGPLRHTTASNWMRSLLEQHRKEAAA